ncbi:MAG: DNA translocase FtsK, partial [Leptospirales bacterium]
DSLEYRLNNSTLGHHQTSEPVKASVWEESEIANEIDEIFSDEDQPEKYEIEIPEEESKLLEPIVSQPDSEVSPEKSVFTQKNDTHDLVHHRSSVTPKVNIHRQIQIPYRMLETSAKSELFEDPEQDAKIIDLLESTLEEFGIEARVIGIQRGPIITRYELKIPGGIKVNRILNLSDELAMALEAIRVRIEAPIPGRSTIGIEIPNKKRQTVLLGDILNTDEYKNFTGSLPLPLGKDIAGKLIIEDLCKMPHLLIAGATGSGKSVCVNSFITSLIINKTPEEVRLLLVDPKLVELSHYNDIPHLLHPVIVDSQKAVAALNWAVEEMERRYEDMAELRARDISSFNEKAKEFNSKRKKAEMQITPMPYIVILIDELGDLMMVAGKDVEHSIIRLSQKARAVGIHLILATQRPSVDVITALIKANCPARIALQVAQKTDSRTILDGNGGEQLLGQGDMLFKHPSKGQLIRAQAPLVKDHEVEEVVELTKKSGKPSYITLEDPRSNLGELEMEDEQLFEDAWNIIIESNKASASYLQRRLRIGYNRAARLIEAFEARGYIGPQIGSKPREIFGNDQSSR